MKFLVFSVICLLSFSGSQGFFLPFFDDDYDWTSWFDDSGESIEGTIVQNDDVNSNGVVVKNVTVVCSGCHVTIKCENCTVEKTGSTDNDLVQPETVNPETRPSSPPPKTDQVAATPSATASEKENMIKEQNDVATTGPTDPSPSVTDSETTAGTSELPAADN
uniref:ParSP60-like secreted protein n=1 Tax=Sergentomyia schwetzi TaxID=114605 RepID=A0A6B9VJZ8_9DIPT|nr:ParSP60-like secreted protein [Sergentomyia schwetzi]